MLKKTFYLNDVRVDHPVVHVFEHPHRTDNLPQTKSDSQQKNKTSVFDLGVRHALLDRGEVYHNNRKSILEADLHDLNFQSAFDAPQKTYSGTLAYRYGHLRSENLNPLV